MRRRTPVVLLCLIAACARGTPAPDLSGGGRIHVAAIQVTAVDGDLAANQAALDGLVRAAAARGARYILLPEKFPGQLQEAPGATVESLRGQAQPLDGPIARHMLALSRELDVYLAFPLAERRADGGVYNSTVYAGPGGVEGVYSKVALVGSRTPPPQPLQRVPEAAVFEPGTSDGVITWGGVRVGALICADGGFPNFYEDRRAKGVQLFTHASGSMGLKTASFNPMPDAAARRYQRPVVFANQRRRDRFGHGNSQICDASGTVLAHAGAEPNAVIDAIVDVPPVPAASDGH